LVPKWGMGDVGEGETELEPGRVSVVIRRLESGIRNQQSAVSLKPRKGEFGKGREGVPSLVPKWGIREGKKLATIRSRPSGFWNQ